MLYTIIWTTIEATYRMTHRGTWAHPNEGLAPIKFASPSLAEEWMVEWGISIGDIVTANP